MAVSSKIEHNKQFVSHPIHDLITCLPMYFLLTYLRYPWVGVTQADCGLSRMPVPMPVSHFMG